jgi:hypothetical protein
VANGPKAMSGGRLHSSQSSFRDLNFCKIVFTVIVIGATRPSGSNKRVMVLRIHHFVIDLLIFFLN